MEEVSTTSSRSCHAHCLSQSSVIHHSACSSADVVKNLLWVKGMEVRRGWEPDEVRDHKSGCATRKQMSFLTQIPPPAVAKSWCLGRSIRREGKYFLQISALNNLSLRDFAEPEVFPLCIRWTLVDFPSVNPSSLHLNLLDLLASTAAWAKEFHSLITTSTGGGAESSSIGNRSSLGFSCAKCWINNLCGHPLNGPEIPT